MPPDVFLTGTGEVTGNDKIRQMVNRSGTGRLFFASAYVSWAGVDRVKDALTELGTEECAAVFGLDGYVTEPSAIEYANELDWGLRLVEASANPFHPKIALAGGDRPSPYLDGSEYGFIGSSNFTKGGLETNIEAGLITQDSETVNRLRDVAQNVWEMSSPVTDVNLDEYSNRYAEIERMRSTEVTHPGKGETEQGEEESEFSGRPAYNPDNASAVWVGLESFTGEHTFQVEFPKVAAAVVRNLISADQQEVEVKVECVDEPRDMLFSFYKDNQMDRLNIPNDVPGVSRAREAETGIALIEQNLEGDAPIQLSILFDDSEGRRTAADVEKRSKRVGTLQRTDTRAYGWF